MVWAALTFMNRIPIPEGSSCIFRVVRVSGTIRKAEQEAVRRARQFILAAKEDAASGSSGSLVSLLGKPGKDGVDAMADEVMDESLSESDGEAE